MALRLPEDAPTPAEFRRFPIEDVDGDGRPDFLLAARQTCGAHNCTAELYVSGRGCLRRLGELAGANFSVLPESHRSLATSRASG